MVPPGCSAPDFSAASIIREAIRSFTEPPGLRYSTFASTSGPGLAGSRSSVRSSLTSGVLPISSSRELAYSMASTYPRSFVRRIGGYGRLPTDGRHPSQISRFCPASTDISHVLLRKQLIVPQARRTSRSGPWRNHEHTTGAPHQGDARRIRQTQFASVVAQCGEDAQHLDVDPHDRDGQAEGGAPRLLLGEPGADAALDVVEVEDQHQHTEAQADDAGHEAEAVELVEAEAGAEEAQHEVQHDHADEAEHRRGDPLAEA